MAGQIAYSALTHRIGGQMGKLLIVGNRSLGGTELAALVGERARSGPSEAHLVVPVPNPVASAVAIGASAPDMAPTLSRDIEDDRRSAQEQLDFGLTWLAGLGMAATGELSLDADTPAAVARLVEQHGFDEVIVSTLPTKVSRWLRQDLPCRIGRKVSVPVTVVSTTS
jgi:GABA permease